MPDYSAGSAYISIIPTLLGDKASIQRQLDTALAGVNADIPVKVNDPDIAAAKAKVDELSREVEAANQRQIASNNALAKAEADLEAARANPKGSEALIAAESEVARAKQASQLATTNLTAAENYAGTSEEVLAERRATVARTTAALSSAETELTRVKAAEPAASNDVSSAEQRVATAREESSRAAEDARGASERLGSAQSTLKRLLDDNGKSSDNQKSGLDKLGSSADKAAGSVLGFSASLLTTGISTAATTFGMLGLAQGALNLTSALLPAAGALGLLPALGIAGAAAIGTIKIGTQNFGQAIKDVGTPQFAADLAKLSPSARDAAQGIASLKPAYDSLQLAVQQQLFLGLGGTIRSLGADYLPIARTGFTGMASAMNGAVQQVGGFLKAPATIAMLRATTDNVVTGFRNFSGALEPVIRGLTGVGAVGSSFLPQLGSEVTSVAQKFGAWLDRMNASGQMWQWINTGLSVLRSLGELVMNVGDILMKVLGASAQAGSNMISVLVTLTGNMKNFLDSGQGMAFLRTIFDNIHTALMALQPLIDAVGNGLKAVLPPVTAALGDVGRALGSLAPSIPVVVNAIKELAPVAGQAAGVLAGALNGSVRALGPIVSVAAGALGAMMPFLSAIAPVVGPAALGIYALVKATQGIKAAFDGIKSGIETFQKITEAVKAFSLAETIASVQSKAVAIGEGIASAATSVWSGIMVVFDAIVSANPIAILVIAIVGLIAVVVLVATHFTQFKAIALTVWDAVKNACITAFNAIVDFLKQWGATILAVFVPFLGIPLLIIQHWGVISGWFQSLWNGIVSIFMTVWNAIRGVVMTVWNAIAAYLTAMFQVHYALWMQIWNAISGFFIGIWDAIRNTAVTVWNAISSFFVGAFNAFVAFFEMIWNREVAFWTGIWEAIRNAAVSVWNAIVAFLQPAINAFVAFFEMIWNREVAFWTGIWNAVRDTAVTVWNAIVAFLQPAINAFSAFFSAVWSAISAFFSMIWNGIKLEATTLWNDISAFFTGAFNAFSSFFGAVWNGIRTTFSNIWNGISSDAQAIWNGIITVVKNAVNGVIDAANGMINGVDIALKFLLIPTIPDIPKLEAGGTVPMYASGTNRIGGGFKTSGPTAIVGEGRQQYPEYVIPTDPQYKSRATALHAAAGADLGMPMMADGGIIGEVGSWLGSAGNWVANTAAGAWDGITNAAKDAANWVGSGLTGLENTARAAVDRLMPPGMFHGVGDWLVDKIFPVLSGQVQAAQAAAGGGSAAMGPMSASHALDIVNAAKSKGLHSDAATIAIMTGLQESSLRVLANPAVPASMSLPHDGVGFDHDSVGIFQQRQSWGPTPLLMNPFGSAQLFYNKLGTGPYGDFGSAAQRVQVSAFPGAYSKWQGQAAALVGPAFERGGVLPAQSFDIPVGSTGMLPEGLSLTYNGTGSAEPLTRMDTSGITGAGSSSLAGMQIQGTLELDPTMTTGFVDARVSGGLSAVAAGLNNGPRG